MNVLRKLTPWHSKKNSVVYPGKDKKSQRKIFTFRRRTMSVEATEVLDNSLLTWISGEDLELIMRREQYLSQNDALAAAGEVLPMLEISSPVKDGKEDMLIKVKGEIVFRCHSLIMANSSVVIRNLMEEIRAPYQFSFEDYSWHDFATLLTLIYQPYKALVAVMDDKKPMKINVSLLKLIHLMNVADLIDIAEKLACKQLIQGTVPRNEVGEFIQLAQSTNRPGLLACATHELCRQLVDGPIDWKTHKLAESAIQFQFSDFDNGKEASFELGNSGRWELTFKRADVVVPPSKDGNDDAAAAAPGTFSTVGEPYIKLFHPESNTSYTLSDYIHPAQPSFEDEKATFYEMDTCFGLRFDVMRNHQIHTSGRMNVSPVEGEMTELKFALESLIPDVCYPHQKAIEAASLNGFDNITILVILEALNEWSALLRTKAKVSHFKGEEELPNCLVGYDEIVAMFDKYNGQVADPIVIE